MNAVWQVLVVDPAADVRNALCELLSRATLEVQAVATGQQALALCGEQTPRLVICEVDLPDMSGFELCRELRDAHGDETAIVLLTASRDPHTRVAGLLIGADDVVGKPIARDELLARARNLTRRFAPRTIRTSPLTPREHEVLSLLAAGLDQRAIAEQLVVSSRTVSTHIERILRKAGVKSRAEAVAWAYRHQLVAA